VYFRLDEASGERVMVVLNRNPEPVTLDTKRFHRWVKPGTKGRHVLEQRAYTLPETLELAPKEPFLFSFR